MPPPPTEETAPPSPRPGVRRLGDYELLKEIARGGMGIVHRARQISLNRIVALKLILGGELAGREQAQRFRTEAQAAANLRHPHIVAIHEVGEHAGQLYFSMDFIEGKNLAQAISDLRFQISDSRRSARWMKAVAEAVHYAHEHGILHRDLKPANIIIDHEDQPHITDFGLAKRLVAPSSGSNVHEVPGAASGTEPAKTGTTNELTLSGQVLGSPSYLSPEQAEGRRGAVGVASDVYSLGAVLYHLLTGRPPFQGESLTALLRQVIETEPVAPRLLNPSTPRDLETICLKCLEKETHRRYASAQELADELGRFLASEPIRARRSSRTERAWRWCRRNPKLAGALGAVVLSLALGLATTTWQMRRAQESEADARQRAYVSDMDLANRALAEEDTGRVRALLNRYRPAPGQASRITDHASVSADLRGWEWQYLWMKSRNRAAFPLCARSKAIHGLAFTGHGPRLVVHEARGITLVYDLATREPVPDLVQTNFCFRMGLCPIDDRVAYGFSPGAVADGEIRIWDLRRNAIVSRLDYRTNAFNSLAFSPDGGLLACLGVGGAVVWNVSTGERVMSIPVETAGGEIFTGAITFDPTGEVLAIGDRANGEVRLFRVPGQEVEREFKLGEGGVLALTFSPSGRWLAASALAANTTARVWSLPAGEPMELAGQRQPPWALAFDPRSELLASGDGQVIRLWDLTNRALLTSLTGHRLSVTALAFSPDGKWLASGSNGRGQDCSEVLLWDLATVKRLAPPDPQVLSNVGLVAFETNAQSFLALAAGVVTRFDIETLKPIESLSAYGASNADLAVSCDGQWLAHAERNGMVHVWDRNARREWTSFCPYPGTRPARGTMRLLAQGRLLAARPADGRVPLYIWDTESGQQPEPWRSLNVSEREACITVDVSRDGRLLATGQNDGRVILWNLNTRRQLAMFPGQSETVMEVAFSPDAHWLASAAWDSALRLWDVRQRREAGSLRGAEAPCYGITFSPDGRRVANGGLTGSLSVVIWDVATQQHLIDLARSERFFCNPRFSPDGRTLAVQRYDDDGNDSTYFWRVPALAEIDVEREPQRGAPQTNANPHPHEQPHISPPSPPRLAR